MSKRIADGKKNFISLPFILFKISSPGNVEKHDGRCRAIRGFLKQICRRHSIFVHTKNSSPSITHVRHFTHISLINFGAVAKGIRFSILITLTAVSVNCIERRSCFATPLGELKFKKICVPSINFKAHPIMVRWTLSGTRRYIVSKRKASGSIAVLVP
jgi:hypothetical protein